MVKRTIFSAVLAGFLMLPVIAARPDTASAQVPPSAAPVVVATFDTGTNPFHPCFRRDWGTASKPRRFIKNYPKEAVSLPLTFGTDYQQSLTASQPVLDSIRQNTLYFVPGTNLSYMGRGVQAKTSFVDDYPHGAQASSQIACESYGMGSNAHLVILNWYDDPSTQEALVDWVAAQPWIDVVHLNIQDTPVPIFTSRGIDRLIATGKLVVIAAGNGVRGLGASYPMELSRWNGPPGSLIAGANDNDGWQVYSNFDPHVVMDGGDTVSAAPDSFEEDSFGGTSSASPRVTGYVTQIIGRLRAMYGHAWSGLLTIPAGKPRPVVGPLADGVLMAAELHEVVRKTAYPSSHDSRWDGGQGIYWMPEPDGLPAGAQYFKIGYGEVSEHTIDHAIRVLTGVLPMPKRAADDEHYNRSESLREMLWGS